MNFIKNILLILIIFPLSSCSSLKKSISLGVGVGAVSGIGTAHILGRKSNKSSMQGLAIGALLGGITSYLIYNGLEKRDANVRKETLFNLEKFDVYGRKKKRSKTGEAPFTLAPAIIEQDYVETHIKDGKKLIEGHRTWTISEETQWQPHGN